MIYYKLLIYLILLSVGITSTFETSIGICNLEIYEGKTEHIIELENLIKEEVNNLVNKYGKIEKNKFSIYITSNLNEFNKQAKGKTPEWGIAVAKRNPERIIIKPPKIINISFNRLKKIIIHELNHIYIFRIKNYSSIPSWFKEGLAMKSSKEFSLINKIEISKSIWKNNILPLNKIKNFNLLHTSNIQLAYSESAAAIEALEYYYGNEILKVVLNNMQKNMSFNKALEQAINEPLYNFEIFFESFLKQNYNWIFLLKSPKYFYMFLPIILIFGFIFQQYRKKIIYKKWEIEEGLEDLECEKLKN